MLGSMISGFITLLIGFFVITTVAQQLNLAMSSSCNMTNSTGLNESNITIMPIADTGATNSFGGAGTSHFGGYDGKVTHANFTMLQSVGQYSVIQGNQSALGCINLGVMGNTILGISPAFMAIAVLGGGIAMVWGSLRDLGMM